MKSNCLPYFLSFSLIKEDEERKTAMQEWYNQLSEDDKKDVGLFIEYVTRNLMIIMDPILLAFNSVLDYVEKGITKSNE